MGELVTTTNKLPGPSPKPPALDELIEWQGRTWDVRNVYPVDRYIDGIRKPEYKFTTNMYHLQAQITGESLALEESLLLRVLSL